MSSSSTLTLWAFSLADIMSDVVAENVGDEIIVGGVVKPEIRNKDVYRSMRLLIFVGNVDATVEPARKSSIGGVEESLAL